MKKIPVALLVVAVVSSFCFVKLPQAGAEETKIFIGGKCYTTPWETADMDI